MSDAPPSPHSGRRSWTALTLACAAATVFVGLLAPPMALVGAALLTYCAWRARRERRDPPAPTKGTQ